MSGEAGSQVGRGVVVVARKEPLRAVQAGFASLFFLFATFATFGPWFSLPLALGLMGTSIVLGLLGLVLAHRAGHALRRNPWARGEGFVIAGWLASLLGVVVSSVYTGVAIFALSPLTVFGAALVLLVGGAVHAGTRTDEEFFLGRLDPYRKSAVCMACGRRASLARGRWRGDRWLCGSCGRPRVRIPARALGALLALFLGLGTFALVPAQPADAFCEILEPASDLPTEVRGTQIEIRLTEGFARIVIIKEFFNPSDRLKEGQVFFPLEKGHELITDLSLKIGNVVYNSSSGGQEEALEDFLDALANGKDAALVQYDAPRDVYWIAVTIPPRESRTTITTLEMPLAKRDGWYGYDYRLSVDAGHSTEYLRLHLSVETSAPLDGIRIPSHPDVPVLRVGTRWAEAYINSTAEAAGRDLEVRFRSASTSIGQFAESVNGTATRYVRLSVDSLDPAFSGSLNPAARSFLFLVDASGSMARRARWGTARETVLALVRDLGAGETFGVAAFQGKRVLPMGSGPAAWTPSSESEVAAFLDSVSPAGSTSLTRGLPLMELWAAEANAFGRQPILFLVSDGRPTIGALDVETEGAYRRIAYDAGMPVFALAVEPADHSDENLLRNVSHFNRGDLFTVRHGQVASATAALLDAIRLPVLRDVRASIPGAEGLVLASANPQNVLQGGEATVIARIAGTDSDPFSIRLDWDADGSRSLLRTFAGSEVPVQPLLKKQWVLSRVHGMLDEIAAHRDPAVIEELKAFATANRIVTPYTSLVVTIPRDPPPGTPADGTAFLDLGTDLFITGGLEGPGSPSPGGGSVRPRTATLLDLEAQRADAFWDEAGTSLVTDGEVDRYVEAGSREHAALDFKGAVLRISGQHLSILEIDGELIGVLGGWMGPSGSQGLLLWGGFWTALAFAAAWGVLGAQRRARVARRALEY